MFQLNFCVGIKNIIGGLEYRNLEEDMTPQDSKEQKAGVFKSVESNGGSTFDSKDGPNFQVTGKIRTATGGFIQQVMIFFTIVAFVGNAIFMVNVFFMSR